MQSLSPSSFRGEVVYHYRDFRPQNVGMVRMGKVVVMMLVIGLAVTSYCAQACSMPQSSTAECPQHQHSGNTNCCEHSSADATMTAKVDCALGIKSAALIFVPVQSTNISSLLNREMDFHQRYGPSDSVLQYSIHAPLSVLRV